MAWCHQATLANVDSDPCYMAPLGLNEFKEQSNHDPLEYC